MFAQDLSVKPREIINLRNEQLRLLELPLFQGCHRAHMTQGPRWQVVIIDLDIAL